MWGGVLIPALAFKTVDLHCPGCRNGQQSKRSQGWTDRKDLTWLVVLLHGLEGGGGRRWGHSCSVSRSQCLRLLNRLAEKIYFRSQDLVEWHLSKSTAEVGDGDGEMEMRRWGIGKWLSC